MTKFLYCAPPRYGHVVPMLAIVKEMIEQGAEITYFCTEQFAEAIQETGATFKPYKTTLIEDAHMQNIAELDFESSDPTVNESFYVLPQLIEVARAEKADCLIYDDFCLWGRILAQILRLPAIIMLSSYARNEQFNHFDYFRKRLQIDIPTIIATEDVRQSLVKLCETYKIEPFPFEDIFFHTEPLNLIRIPREFHPMGETFDEKRFKFVGSTIRSHEDIGDFPLDRLSKEPVLFATLGTVFTEVSGMFDLFLSAFGHQSQQLVIAIGKNIDPSVFGPLPENVILHPHVPQLTLLRHTDIFISHGGLNGVMEALANGVPMIAIPQVGDQVATAFRLQELKLGIMLDPSIVTVHTLRTAISILKKDPAYRANAQRMQKIVQQLNGARDAAREILDYSHSLFVNK
ncbi:macrolide family glycosyltransferase [Tengunoibacter tsumagoiensis]|uniref:Putative UDP-glucosyltransferase YjiC n=1 Tax=Tengunoibacter tsumagoiensis TaxID=2014871 RepID=A0A402A6W7_9CHLR|nr:macrolide family glycosyltransferase [Tengunoibacter tsumagoiensis]GCE14874.1 putative UDP-glucosyltransferase YjiC [Tengunoibacter tsumagoiensis]